MRHICVTAGCFHEFCTYCALYLCSTTNTSTATHGPPGSIPCPLCRHGIVSFIKLANTQPIITKEIGRSRSLAFCTCSSDVPECTSLETALCKPDSSFESLNCQIFPSVKFNPGLCLGAPDASPSLVSRNADPIPDNQLVRCSRSSFRRSSSANEGQSWLCSFIHSVPTGSGC